VTPLEGSRNPFLIAVVHQKSKKTYSPDEQEPYNNRKKIIAQGRRLRTILYGMLERGIADRFFIIGDINDGPGFDEYEKTLVESGVEAHLGTVLDPDHVLRSFVDLSQGGRPTHPFKPAAQIDHILYTENAARSSTKVRVRKNSGDVRTDLVSIKKNGKDRDSDHCPIEVTVLV
jgi:endonuclease/exonuclease/phosphatase family metal-dependent hydrolase